MTGSDGSLCRLKRTARLLPVAICSIFTLQTALGQSFTISTSSALNEVGLDGQTITIELLDGESFLDLILPADSFSLVGEPPGTSIGSVAGNSLTSAALTLNFDGTDFDIDHNIGVEIRAGELTLTGSGSLGSSNTLTITAYIENPQIDLSIDSTVLEERWLDTRILTVNLIDERFRDYTSLQNLDFDLLNGPQGLEIESVAGISLTSADILLQFNYTDFDTDWPDFRVSIDQLALVQSGTDLVSDPEPVLANIESATLVPDMTLWENNLDGRILTVTLENEVFTSPGLVNENDFDLVNYPVGLIIVSASAVSATQAELTLQYTGTDFDTDITDFAVGIAPDVLRYSSSGNLNTGPITIHALVENPSAVLESDGVLIETNLDVRELIITLEQEEFNPAVTIDSSHFRLGNEPTGLAIESAYRITPDSARILLRFDGTDFDQDITDFFVEINAAALIQTTSGWLPTNSIPIQANLEPVITGVSIPNDTMKIGDTVRVSITVEDDQGNVFSLASGAIGGYPLEGLTRDNDTTYISGFGVAESGNEYAAAENIPVTGVQLNNGTIPGNIYSQDIIQGNDLLDANRPEIIYIVDNTLTGGQDIGSEIRFRVHTDEAGYSFDPASHVNDVLFSSPDIRVVSLPDGYYDLFYTVSEGDSSVSEGNLELELMAIDDAGNRSDPFSEIGPNDLSIDATRPVISRTYISSTDSIIIVGETLEITVVADQPGYRNNENSLINNVPVGPSVTFHDLDNGNYLFRYTVQEDDREVPAGELEIMILLQDAEPYDNTSDSFWNLDSNNVAIIPNRPEANIIGDTAVCFGDQVQLSVILTGLPPLAFDLFNGTDTTTYSNCPLGLYPVWVHPTVPTDYTVTRVVDVHGNSNVGSDTASVIVHPPLNVYIDNLESTYALSAPRVDLSYYPPGGEFTGNGISPSAPWTFTPSLAGVENSPHEIIYTYTDNTTTCSNADTVYVAVIDAPGDILFEKSVACFNDSTFYITGYNDGLAAGQFSIEPTAPPGAFFDLENDTALLVPGAFGFDSTRDVYITYSFTDQGGQALDIRDTLTIERLEAALIQSIPDFICQNGTPVDLAGLPSGGIFSGPGVMGSLQDGFRFYPGMANLDTNLIQYIFTSENYCNVQTSDRVIVQFAPVADFTFGESCLPEEGGWIRFTNLSDTGYYHVERWHWNFEYPSNDPENQSDSISPSHYYDALKTRTVQLDVLLYNGCSDLSRQILDLSAYPEAEFTWNSNCETDDPILFEGQEGHHVLDTISSRIWNVYNTENELILSDSNKQLNYNFPAEGFFRIAYQVKTTAGCADSVQRIISLRPTHRLTDESYFENFENPLHGWTQMAEDPLQNSWIYGEINPDRFPRNAASGSRAWYTDLPEAERIEHSWVESPCFNFEGFHRPMVSFDIKRSLDQNEDGVVLQYTMDNGDNWMVLGGVNDGGLNWYNSTGIWNGPANQNTGWTGELIFSEDEQWYRAAHALDELSGQKEVRFRIAYGSNGGSTLPNDGFAFDNFTIKQRNRLSVLEYFTNANKDECRLTDELIYELVDRIRSDVIDIQYHYHAFEGLPDNMYLDNPIPGNNRASLYGVYSIPMAILDGGGGPFQETLGYPLVYDFSPANDLAEVDIRKRSLVESDFLITIDTVQSSPEPILSVSVEALTEQPKRELVLQTIILENRITDPAYEGTNGTEIFYRVVRKMVPDAAGNLFDQSWVSGDVETIDLNEEDFSPLHPDSISIVFYLQDENTREILQAASTIEYTPVSTSIQVEPEPEVILFPNPASDLINVHFDFATGQSLRFDLYDLSGKTVITDIIQPWQQLFTRSLAPLDKGLYIVVISAKSNNRVFYRGKILILP